MRNSQTPPKSELSHSKKQYIRRVQNGTFGIPKNKKRAPVRRNPLRKKDKERETRRATYNNYMDGMYAVDGQGAGCQDNALLFPYASPSGRAEGSADIYPKPPKGAPKNLHCSQPNYLRNAGDLSSQFRPRRPVICWWQRRRSIWRQMKAGIRPSERIRLGSYW